MSINYTYIILFPFAFSYCSQGSQGNNAKMVCHSLLQLAHVLSELSTMTCPSWVTLHGMSHSFIELDKVMIDVISLVSSVVVVFTLSAL